MSSSRLLTKRKSRGKVARRERKETVVVVISQVAVVMMIAIQALRLLR